ncbi:hypothetical protein HCN44_006867 [Aphidius gifuensis]|uniref:Uncharacterized protein n=1 Tax=Aphidius gifuensis TaxID=684658 RepID=A0A834XY96_APHGI|nr:hypothetical protein HCN44_006867 [Aphidius gifuensis]
MHTKVVSARPHLCVKSTPTDEVQKILVPIPVPIYIPFPVHMFSFPVSIPILSGVYQLVLRRSSEAGVQRRQRRVLDTSSTYVRGEENFNNIMN